MRRWRGGMSSVAANGSESWRGRRASTMGSGRSPPDGLEARGWRRRSSTRGGWTAPRRWSFRARRAPARRVWPGRFTPAAGARVRCSGHLRHLAGGTGRGGVVRDSERRQPVPGRDPELPGALQPKLLRVLEDGQVRAWVRRSHVDVRIIAASREPLAQAVTDGRFRADLQARLEGLTVVLPPLRARREDIAAVPGTPATALRRATAGAGAQAGGDAVPVRLAAERARTGDAGPPAARPAGARAGPQEKPSSRTDPERR